MKGRNMLMTSVCWGMLAVVHALPALALFRPTLISSLYGVEAGSSTYLLLHHRAALFLVIFVICAWAVFRPETRQLATASVGISMLSFLLLYWLGGLPPALRSIAIGDLIGLPFLAFAGWQAFRLS